MATPIVVNANVVIAAAVRRGTTYHRIVKLLLDPRYDLYMPSFMVEETLPKLETLATRKGILLDELNLIFLS